MQENARIVYVKAAIHAPVEVNSPLFRRYGEETRNALIHLDLDGTAEKYGTPEPFWMVIERLRRKHKPFAEEENNLRYIIKEAYERRQSQEFRRKLSDLFTRCEVTVDLLYECIDESVKEWQENVDLYPFLMEQLPSINAEWTWDSGNFSYLFEKVNETRRLKPGRTPFATDVDYNPKTRIIRKLTPNILQNKMRQIERHLIESHCSRYRFIFIGDSPPEEPDSARMAFLAFWLREGADITKSPAKINVKIPEAKIHGLSLLFPMIKRFIYANYECDVISEAEQLEAFDAVREIKSLEDKNEEKNNEKSGEKNNEKSEVQNIGNVSWVAENAQKLIDNKRLWAFRPNIASEMSTAANLLKAKQLKTQKSRNPCWKKY